MAAKKALYDQYAGKLFSVCLQYTSTREEAEDVLQDVFIKIFQNIKQFKGQGSFEGWLRRITVNSAISHYHKNSKMYALVSPETVPDNSDEEAQDKENEYDYSADELMGMIQTLAPRYKMVFSLYAIERHSHKEIAEMLNISEGTSKSQLSRARVILQKMLKENLNNRQDVGQ